MPMRTDLCLAALKRARRSAARSRTGDGVVHEPCRRERTNRQALCRDQSRVEAMGFSEKIALLQKADAYARGARSARASRSPSRWRPTGRRSKSCAPTASIYRDVRPLVRFNVSVVSSDGKEQGQGSHGLGGRGEPLSYFTEDSLAGGRARGAAPEPGLARGPAGAGRRDGRAAGTGLARHPAA